MGAHLTNREWELAELARLDYTSSRLGGSGPPGHLPRQVGGRNLG